MATITWKGHVWDLRNGGTGSPGYNGWASGNITGPDVNGYLTLQITNPTGSKPVGCEMTTQDVVGYGTYISVVNHGNMQAAHKNIVWGAMFPINGVTPYIEFDCGETSKWDQDFAGVAQTDHIVWHGSVSAPSDSGTNDTWPSSADTITTNRLIWEPGKATFDTWAGVGTGGTLLRHSVFTTNVPAPNGAIMDFNLWTYASGTGTKVLTSATNYSVVLMDFSYTPAGSATTVAVTKSLKYTVKKTPAAKTKSLKYCVKTTPAGPVKTDTYALGNADGSFGMGAPGTRVGQSFTSQGGKLDSVEFSLKKTGTPTGLIYAELHLHSGTFGTSGKPSDFPASGALATSAPIDITTLSTVLATYKFNFAGANRYQMNAGQHYFIVVQYPATAGELAVGSDTSSPTHPGNAAYTNYTQWDSMASDLVFNLYEEITGLHKSLTYGIRIVATTNLTKSLQYTVKKVLSSLTKSLKYTVKAPHSVTKSLKYTVKKSASAITKSLTYKVKLLTAITKGLAYTTKPITNKTKSLKYTTKTIPSAKTKSLIYIIKAPAAVTRSLKYTIKRAMGGLTKSLRYIIKAPASITKSDRYTILIAVDKTKSLAYEIKSGKAKTLGLRYEVADAIKYTRQTAATLPATKSDLSTVYSTQDYIDVATNDGTRVSATGGGYVIHQFRLRSTNNTAGILTTWQGRASIPPTAKAVRLQIYNYNTTAWETLVSNTTATSNQDFTLTASVQTNIANYYGVDNEITLRVYQEK